MTQHGSQPPHDDRASREDSAPAAADSPAAEAAPGDDAYRVYALYEQALGHLAGGNPRSAAEVLELALEQEPTKASLHETLGRAYFASARIAKARGEFEAALEIDPSDGYAHFGVGRCFEREGRLKDAAKHYKLACALSDNAEYRTALARVQARLN